MLCSDLHSESGSIVLRYRRKHYATQRLLHVIHVNIGLYVRCVTVYIPTCYNHVKNVSQTATVQLDLMEYVKLHMYAYMYVHVHTYTIVQCT